MGSLVCPVCRDDGSPRPHPYPDGNIGATLNSQSGRTKGHCFPLREGLFDRGGAELLGEYHVENRRDRAKVTEFGPDIIGIWWLFRIHGDRAQADSQSNEISQRAQFLDAPIDWGSLCSGDLIPGHKVQDS